MDVADGAQRFYSRSNARPRRTRRHGRPEVAAPAPANARRLWPVYLLLILSLGGNGTLAYFLYDLTVDSQAVQRDLAAGVVDVAESVSVLDGDLADLQVAATTTTAAVDDLEEALFGVDSPPGAFDVIGDLKYCINRVVNAVAFNSYYIPRCY